MAGAGRRIVAWWMDGENWENDVLEDLASVLVGWSELQIAVTELQIALTTLPQYSSIFEPYSRVRD